MSQRRRNSQVRFNVPDTEMESKSTTGSNEMSDGENRKRGLEEGVVLDAAGESLESVEHGGKRHHSSHQSLGDVVLRDVVREERDFSVVTLPHNCTVGDAMKTLAQNKILSAPVIMDASLEDDLDSADTYMGMMDVLQLLASVIDEFSKAPQISKLPSQKQLDQFVELGNQFSNRIVYSLASNSSVNFVWKGTLDQPLLEVINEAFLKPSADGSHIHRIAIFGNASRVSNILSQSDIIQYLYDHMDLVPLAQQTVENLKLGSRNLVSVSKNTRAIDAFKKMMDANLTGVAVLDGETLMSNLSASDLRGLIPDDFAFLMKPVEHYLLLEKSHPSTLARLPKPVTCRLHDTLEHVLTQFVEHRVHRVYIVDDDFRPFGVITMTDVLRVIAAGRQPAHHFTSSAAMDTTTTTTTSGSEEETTEKMSHRRGSLPGIKFVHGGTAIKTNAAAEAIPIENRPGA